MRRECRERFPLHRVPKEPLVSDPDMHHGTCVTHMPWCKWGNVPGNPGACATRNFTYLVRVPWRQSHTVAYELSSHLLYGLHFFSFIAVTVALVKLLKQFAWMWRKINSSTKWNISKWLCKVIIMATPDFQWWRYRSVKCQQSKFLNTGLGRWVCR